MIVACPVCGEHMDASQFPTHLDELGDDAHVEKFRELERLRDDAYFDAEMEFAEQYEID